MVKFKLETMKYHKTSRPISLCISVSVNIYNFQFKTFPVLLNLIILLDFLQNERISNTNQMMHPDPPTILLSIISQQNILYRII